MKFLSLIMIAVCLVSTTALFSQQSQQLQKKPCGCKDCKCTTQSHCGCYSDKGCNCKADGVSCCGNSSCNG